MMHGSDVRLSTFKGSRDAKQTHEVRGVSVKELAIVMSAEVLHRDTCRASCWLTGRWSDIS